MRSRVCSLFQLDDDAGFPSSEWDETTTSFEYTLPIELCGGTHTWRVQAVNASEVGDWSQGWAFTVLMPALTERKLYLPVVAIGCS